MVSKRITLASAGTLLSTEDPIRVYQQFATLDALSYGRAEITAGSGSSTESFLLFGYSLNDYDELYAEKLDLPLRTNEAEMVSWEGKHRPSISSGSAITLSSTRHLPWSERLSAQNSNADRLERSECRDERLLPLRRELCLA